MRSSASKSVDDAIRISPGPILRDHGFRNRRRAFHREGGGVHQLVGFQTSRWSEPGEARVTINLNVTVPKFHEAWTGTPFPPSPMAAAVVLSQRIGLLSPEGRDTWWIVQERGPIQDVAAEMSDLIVRYGLPFLDSVSSLDSLLLHVGSCERPDGLQQNPKLVRAVMRHICGEEREARDLFTELVADKGHSADAAAIVAGRLGVETAS